MSRRRASLPAATLAALAVAAPAQAPAQEDRGLLGIAPVRRIVVDRPPVTLAPVQFSNTTNLSYGVKVFPALLAQRTDGTIYVRDDRESLDAAADVVRLSGTPPSFTMRPDQRFEEVVRWLRIPEGIRAIGIGAVFQATPLVESGQLNNVIRLINSNFLEIPGPADRKLAIPDVGAEQGPKRTLVFTPTVVNDGQVFERPRNGHVSILDGDGKEVARAPFEGDIIFPRTTRRYRVTTRKVLPAGDYTALAAFRVRGLPPVIGRSRFRLVGPNQLPTARLRLLSLRAEGEAGGQAQVSVQLVNSGTLAIRPLVMATLYRAFRGQRLPGVVARRTIRPGRLSASARRTLSVRLGQLEQREYEVVLRARAAGAPPAVASAGFVAREQRSFWDRFWDWVTDHAVLLIALGALLVILIVVLLMRRSQRRIREELDARPTPAASAPDVPALTAAGPTPGEGDPVDLNSASVAVLATLPGVGPRAAQRIVDHRDEYGAFASVDDLQAVDGFDPQRIDRLRGRAKVYRPRG